MRKRIPQGIAVCLFLALSVGVASLQAHAAPQDKAADKYRVKIDNFTFGPATLTVPAGTTVTWVNADDIPHNVVADDKSFKSKVLDTDETYAHTFDKPGTYTYFCSIHPKMTGKVVVQ